MKISFKNKFLLPVLFIYLLIPIVYLILGDFPERDFYKDLISILVIGAFGLILAQFYLSRINKKVIKNNKMSTIIKNHKIIGYIIIFVLLIHPFMVVMPKFFDSGITSIEAFQTMITTYSSKGIILGLIAWVILVILLITSLFRKKIPMKYTTWRVFHGVLAIIFVILSTIHAVNLGRHTNVILSFYIVSLAALGVLLLLKKYLVKPNKGFKNE